MAQGLTNTKGVDTAQYAIRLDVEGSITYVGEAAPGSADSAAIWRIKQMTETGPDLVLLWADGDKNFDNVWSDRASLSYS